MAGFRSYVCAFAVRKGGPWHIGSKCTTMDGTSITINIEHVAAIRPHNRDRGGTGCEIIFAGSPTSLIVKEDEELLTQAVKP